jgi:carboxyl-terminal processing protease
VSFYPRIRLTLRQIRTFVLIITLIILAGGSGYFLGQRQISFDWENYQPKVSIEREVPVEKQDIDFSLFWNVWDELSASYLDKSALSPAKMVYGAIQGMVASLGDPYTVFLPPEDQQRSKEDLGGSFDGVGIQLGYKDGTLAVIAPLSGMPAEKAGVRAGDLILKIEDQETTEISLPEAVNLIRGPKGTTIKLTLQHEGESGFYEAAIVRDTIVVPSVEVEIQEVKGGEKIAHLKLTRFGERTDQEWQEAVNKILTARPNGVILDLRNNPGGYLSGAVFIASEFLSQGVVVQQESADGHREAFSVNRRGSLLTMPLVVLVNEGSASASEIVAGALMELDRAKLAGKTTFGKGTIQEAQDLPGGTGLHITTARWLLPSGESIDKKGVTPDFEVNLDPEKPEEDAQLEKAIGILLEM